MTDEFHSRKCIAVRNISHDVIIMPVGVDDVLNRLAGQFSQSFDCLSASTGCESGVNYNHVIIVNDEYCVAVDRESGWFSANTRVDSLGNFYHFELWFLSGDNKWKEESCKQRYKFMDEHPFSPRKDGKSEVPCLIPSADVKSSVQLRIALLQNSDLARDMSVLVRVG